MNCGAAVSWTVKTSRSNIVYAQHVDLIPQYAAELVQARVDVITTAGEEAVRAVQHDEAVGLVANVGQEGQRRPLDALARGQRDDVCRELSEASEPEAYTVFTFSHLGGEGDAFAIPEIGITESPTPRPKVSSQPSRII